MLHGHSTRESASVDCDDGQNDLYYSAGPHGNLHLQPQLVVSSAQSLDRLRRQEVMTDESILFQCFLQEAITSSNGMCWNVRSLMLSIQHFLCRSQRCALPMVS